MGLLNFSRKGIKKKRTIRSFIFNTVILLGSIIGNPSVNEVSAQELNNQNLLTFVQKNSKNQADVNKYIQDKNYTEAYKSSIKGLSTSLIGSLMGLPSVFKIGLVNKINSRQEFYAMGYLGIGNSGVKDLTGRGVSTVGKEYLLPTHFVDVIVNYPAFLEAYRTNQTLIDFVKQNNGILDEKKNNPEVTIRLFLFDANYEMFLNDLVDEKTMVCYAVTIYSENNNTDAVPLFSVLPVHDREKTPVIISNEKKSPVYEEKPSYVDIDTHRNIGRKRFVAYGHRISHDDCKSGSHTGDGNQTQQCGKFIKIKSYHRADDGTEMTPSEVNTYVGSDH